MGSFPPSAFTISSQHHFVASEGLLLAGGGGGNDSGVAVAYEAACKKAQDRANRFGTDFKPPDPVSMLPWSEAKRLRENPDAGFVTGIDIFTDEEKARARSRSLHLASSS